MSELRIMAPDPAIHREQIIELIAKTFEGYWMMRQQCLDGYIDNSSYDWSNSRVGVVGDTVVSHFGVFDFAIRLAPGPVGMRGKPGQTDNPEVVLRLACIGAVATHQDYRGHGYMARVASSCVDDLETSGYDLSLLFGIRNFYHRFGYVRAWAEPTWEVHWKQLAPGRTPSRELVIEPFEGPVDLLAASYNRANRGVSGTVVRPSYHRNRNPKNWRINTVRYTGKGARKSPEYVVTRVDGDALVCVDSAGEPAKTLEALAVLAERERAQTVRFPGLPFHSALAEELRQTTCSLSENYTADGGAMVRTVNLGSALDKLAPVLSARIARSAYSLFRGDLIVQDERDELLVHVDSGRVTVESTDSHSSSSGRDRRMLSAPRPTPHLVRANDFLARLLLGVGDPDETGRNAGFETQGEGRELMSVLFPDLRPSIVPWDHF